jgi:putative drug exporter of the RND superfamily
VAILVEVAGETALASDSIDSVVADLGRIALAIMIVTLVLLAVFLRSLLAPAYLLAASLMAVLAALGLTVLMALVALFGRAGMWPGHRRGPARPPAAMDQPRRAPAQRT